MDEVEDDKQQLGDQILMYGAATCTCEGCRRFSKQNVWFSCKSTEQLPEQHKSKMTSSSSCALTMKHVKDYHVGACRSCFRQQISADELQASGSAEWAAVHHKEDSKQQYLSTDPDLF